MKSWALLTLFTLVAIAGATTTARADTATSSAAVAPSTQASPAAPTTTSAPSKPNATAPLAAPKLAYPSSIKNVDTEKSRLAPVPGPKPQDAPTMPATNEIHFGNNASDPNWPFGNSSGTALDNHFDNTGKNISPDQVRNYIVHNPDTEVHDALPKTPVSKPGANSIPGILFFTPSSAQLSPSIAGAATLAFTVPTIPNGETAKGSSIADMTVVGQVLNDTDYGTPEFEALICGHIVTVGILPNASIQIDGKHVTAHELPTGKFIQMTGVWDSSSHFVADSIVSR